ncbi:glycosyl hydrolase family 32 [Kocuria rosea subsp. polaris]|uniref:Glycosyl hydrolase family 32 n=1 Tax=Kocuria rosea subsp. polaris TaxID=136273 RepID=A0A0W8I6M2_KOCRO|nr:glycosyl hydrolase family 32 [Kocuria polaris]
MLSLLGLPPAAAQTAAAASTAARSEAEPYRPGLHYTPEQNWMNDPNGLVYHQGVYHMYYQYNPFGTRWGNMSWGHATSTDLMHWQEQPVAIPQTVNDAGVSTEDIFSGSVVVDTTNSTGFGTLQDPAMVAIYTSTYTSAHPTLAGKQAQSLAYSTDDGQTWTKYAQNPVLDRNSADFRDPKVFRYDGDGGSYWVMAAVEAVERKVVLYKSSDLKSWTFLSDFGPANASEGIWECPDLFPLPVDGDPANTKWVLVVNLNPGSVAGGSGGQYFVGDFDGTTFTSQTTDPVAGLPPGPSLGGFNDQTYNGWTVRNDPTSTGLPWASAPAAGTLPGQNPVTGFIGSGLINSFRGGDASIGSLESPTFTVNNDYLNFLIGGGHHPRAPGTQAGNEPPPGYLLFDGFDYPGTLTEAGWQITGDFTAARNPSTSGGEFAIGKRINTFEGGALGDDNRGTITSPQFYLTDTNIGFLLGGGSRTDGQLQVELLVDGAVVRTATGKNSGALDWQNWDVSAYYGKPAFIRIVDNATGPWGHLTLDHMVLGSTPAQPRSTETSVSLLVDGKTVRSATGDNSETLDWKSWDLRPFRGQQATIRITDNNRAGWGHVLADEFTLSDTRALPRMEEHDWLDWGKDYYATVSFHNAPENRRIMLGWMNNWDYGQDTPTTTWRGAMALPREVTLTQTPQGPRLRQDVVAEISTLRDTTSQYTAPAQDVPAGTHALPVSGELVQIDAEFSPGTAEDFGLTVLGNATEATRIGYSTTEGRLYVDRRNSGNDSFHPAFASLDDAPVALDNGRLRLRIYLDRSSVEVFAQDGTTTITDQVFPSAGATQIGLYSQGGTARLESLNITPLTPTMWSR